MLADPFRLEGEGEVAWTAPVVRYPDAVKRVAAELERSLQRTRPAFLKWICDKLSALPTQTGSGINAALWTDNVIDVCGHYPEDLLQSATLELLRAKTFRPSPAEIVAVIEPRFAERRRMLERANSMLAPITKAEQPFQPEPEADRLRGNITRWRNTGRFGERAVASEQRLAEIEGREVEAWAREVVAAPQPAAENGTPPPMPPPPSVQRVGAIARAVTERWQAGQPVYQKATEQPPLPDAIPE